MNKKKLLAVNLNEFNLNFLKYGAIKYECIYIKRFLSLKNIKTFSEDKIQDKNLDPWVQNISINSGKKSKNHKIFNLGEKIPKNLFQIWDYLSKKKINSAVWGPMNTNFKNSKFIKLFLPDPWNNQSTVKPKELSSFYKLARTYAQNYTQRKNKVKTIYLLNSAIYLINSRVILNLFSHFNIFFLIFIKKRFKNYFLFFLFDIISLYLFKNLTKSKKINFSLIFLNSLAHFQHNNWDNKYEEKDYFLLTDIIFKIIFEISTKYDSLIIYNGFSQKKIKPEFILRPIDPKSFFKSYGIKFYKFHSNMTNGAILTFKNSDELKDQLKKIKQINIFGYQLYETKILKNNDLFCRIQVRSKKNRFDLFSKKEILKNLFYEKEKKLLKKKIDSNYQKFINNIKFIKSTSKHVPGGELFYKGINLKHKKIENIKIYELIKKFYI